MATFARILHFMTHHAILVASLRFQAMRKGKVGIVDFKFRLPEMTLIAIGLLVAFFAFERIKAGVPPVFFLEKPQRPMRLGLDSLRVVVTYGTVARRFFIVMTGIAYRHIGKVFLGGIGYVVEVFMAKRAFDAANQMRLMRKGFMV
jgi:hypothetical protein